MPPGRHENPSDWSNRARVLVLAVAGFAIASYLAAYQVGILTTVWDPLFGTRSSARVLHSALSRLLPLPDAALGALGYLADIALTSIGGSERWRTLPRVVCLLGIVVTGMALVSLVLVFLQAVVMRAFCTVCLASAALSFVIFVLAWEEVTAGIGQLLAPDFA